MFGPVKYCNIKAWLDMQYISPLLQKLSLDGWIDLSHFMKALPILFLLFKFKQTASIFALLAGYGALKWAIRTPLNLAATSIKQPWPPCGSPMFVFLCYFYLYWSWTATLNVTTMKLDVTTMKWQNEIIILLWTVSQINTVRVEEKKLNFAQMSNATTLAETI